MGSCLSSHMYRTHTCGELTKNEVGANVTLAGWVHKRRDFGGLIFVDLRDRYGLTQVVFRPEEVEDMEAAEHLKYEYVINVEGTVVARETNTVNKELATGEIEVSAKKVEILSKAKTLPFEIFDAGKGEEDEELRLPIDFLNSGGKLKIIFSSREDGETYSRVYEAAGLWILRRRF